MVVQNRDDRAVVTAADNRKFGHAIDEPAEAEANVDVLQAPPADAQRVATATDRGLNIGLFDEGLQKRVRDPALVGANRSVMAKRHGHGDLPC